MTLFSQPLVLIFFLLPLVFCASARFFRKSWLYLPAGIFGVGPGAGGPGPGTSHGGIGAASGDSVS